MRQKRKRGCVSVMSSWRDGVAPDGTVMTPIVLASAKSSRSRARCQTFRISSSARP